MKTRVPHLFALTAIAVVSCASAQTVGYWRFEGTDLARLSDSSGNERALTNNGAGFASNTGTSFSNPVPQTGDANAQNAFVLGGGSTQELSLADSGFMPTGDFTIEAYVRFGVDVISNNRVADIATQWASGQEAFRFGISATQLLQIGLNDGSSTRFFTTSGSFTFAAVTDYYVAAVVNLEPSNGTTVTFYVQDLTNGGALQTITGATGAGTLLSSLRDSTTDFIIGGSGDFNPNSYGPVAADEVRLSNGIVTTGDLLISIPEPSTAALIFGMGSIAVITLSRRHKR